MAALPIDVLDKLADDVKAATVVACAKVADIHRIPNPENEYQRGYNEACGDIAAKIGELGVSK